MTRSRLDPKRSAFPSVLGFVARHWRLQPVRISMIALAVLGSTLADVLTPLYAGKLVDAVTHAAANDAAAPDLRACLRAIRHDLESLLEHWPDGGMRR